MLISRTKWPCQPLHPFLLQSKKTVLGLTSKTKSYNGLYVDRRLRLTRMIGKLNGEDREFLVENLLAATSPEYLESIKEARKNYKEGRTTSHNELFGK